MNPKMNTSLRGRGKWGDLLVAVLPLSWCANILLNSNFILRMFEWQNESSLFTVRIHGKQWYWIYKFDLVDAVDILTAPKNMGNNRWVVGTPQELVVCESYLQAMQLRSQADWIKNYFKKKVQEGYKTFKSIDLSSVYTNNIIQQDKRAPAIITNPKLKHSYIRVLNRFTKNEFLDSYKRINKSLANSSTKAATTKLFYNSLNSAPGTAPLDFNIFFKTPTKVSKILSKFITSEFYDMGLGLEAGYAENSYYNFDELDDTWDTEFNLRHRVPNGAIRLVKHLLTPEYFKNSSDLLKFNFFDNANQTTLKIPENNNFWVLKQKRYKKKQLVKVSKSTDIDFADFETVRNLYKKHIMENIRLIQDLDFKMDSYTLYKCVRGNRNRTESLPVHLYRRLLRTKRTLVLPVHVNMTVVTNSYDVVHSWFLPGLGIKMDCVPGRSTHHSLYLDNIGFYYGQCAEICGRYHHHMPIRLCALPFEHFLVWWQLKGLPKLLRLKKQKMLSKTKE